jgi:bleomycin hydrolase
LYQTLKAGQPVFFGCDVGQFSEGSSGIMDTELFEYEACLCFALLVSCVMITISVVLQNAFDISLSLSKADRLRTGESAMTHAMVISGVHLDHQSGKPLRYKVENSWGEGSGEKGFFVMTDRWFDE